MWGLLGPPRGLGGASWWPLEAIRDRLGAILGRLGGIVGELEGLFDSLGQSSRRLGTVLEAILAILESSSLDFVIFAVLSGWLAEAAETPLKKSLQMLKIRHTSTPVAGTEGGGSKTDRPSLPLWKRPCDQTF